MGLESEAGKSAHWRVWRWRALGVLLIAAGLVGTPALWFYWFSQASLERAGQSVAGAIGSYYRESDDEPAPFHPVVEYRLASGGKHLLRDASLVASSEAMAKRWQGKKRTVIVDPANPDHATAAAQTSAWDPENMMMLLVGTGVGVVVLVFGIGVLVSTRPAPTRIDPNRSSVPSVALVGLAVCVVGAATAWFASQHAANYRTLQQDGVDVEGTVVAYYHVNRDHSDEVGYYPVVEYTDHRGETYQTEPGTLHTTERAEAEGWLGETQTLRYHPDNPALAVADPNEVWISEVAAPFVIAALGAGAVPVGLLIVGFSLRRRKRGRAPSARLL